MVGDLAHDRPLRPRSRGWSWFWIGVTLVVVGPAIGLLATIFVMLRSFHEIEAMAAPTPGELAEGVYEGWLLTGVGLLVGLVGVVLIVVGALRIHRDGRDDSAA